MNEYFVKLFNLNCAGMGSSAQMHQNAILVLNFAVFVLKPFPFIHNWPLQPFSQAYNLVPHTTYVNLYT